MPVCEFCGSQNAAGKEWCPKCGRPLPAEGPANPAGAPAALQHWLIAESGPLAGKKFLITSAGLRIGRHPTQNDLVLSDNEVSRLHAQIRIGPDDQVQLEDRGSANHTFVNGRNVERSTLAPGDKVRFALSQDNVFVYRLEKPQAVQPPIPPPEPEPMPQPVVEPGGVARPTVRDLSGGAGWSVPRLQLVLDQYAVEDILLDPKRTELGRASGQGKVRIDHPTVSDSHAEVLLTPQGRAQLRDLHSAHGTFLNGERITERLLSDGDLIQLGACENRLLLYRDPRRQALVLKDIELKKPVVRLGREPSNDVVISHPTVSNFHAEIHKSDTSFELVDRNSTNGSFVNGIRVNRQMLQPNDRISLGAVQLVFDGSQMEGASDAAGVRLAARGLRRTAPDPRTGQTVILLDSVSLAVEPREFVGLLGPAGAGKTTLMHALNGFQPADQGEVLLNGRSFYREFASLRAAVGYVPQEDVLHRALTVRECLYYAARLRLPDDYSEKDIWDRVMEVIKILDLAQRADLAVERLSGGQRKRVSVGIELLSKPGLLFLDEPNAGQDPGTELRMMQLFRQVANRGSTVILSTHLLGSFSLLDKVAVLFYGRLAYFGPSQQMLKYFQVGAPQHIYDRLKQKSKEQWAKEFEDSSVYRDFVANKLGMDGKSAPSPPVPDKPAPGPLPKPSPASGRSTLRQLSTLLSRQLTLKCKEIRTAAGLLLPPPFIALLMGRLLRDTPNHPKALFITAIVALWFGCAASVREIVDEQAIYRRERQCNLTIPAYLGSKLIYLAGLAALQTFLFVGVASLMGVQQRHFLGCWGIMWLLTLHGALIGLLISAVASSPEKALYAFPLALIPQLLLAGLFVPTHNLRPFDPRAKETRCVPPRAQTTPGMGPVLGTVVSPLMVGRWGLEALADMYIHDYRDDPSLLNPGYLDDRNVWKAAGYSYNLLNAVSVTAHKDEADAACHFLESLSSPEGPTVQGPAVGFYASILIGLALVMIALVTWALKRKDSG